MAGDSYGLRQPFFKLVSLVSLPVVLAAILFGVAPAAAGGDYAAPNKGCLASGCHPGIEPIRDHDSEMSKKIAVLGAQRGDPNGCVVCHNGDPAREKDKDLAHKDLIRFAASPWVNQKTCGVCHAEHVYAQYRSIMQTEAGKIQGAMWGWGAPNGYERRYGNYAVDDPDGSTPVFGTEEYKKYTRTLMEKFPYIFPKKLEKLPKVDMAAIADNPQQAVLTYLRSDCQRCHVGVQGRTKRGDMRGMGCAACHIPYSNEGFYEGADPSTPRDKKGHLLVHAIQSTREAKVTVGGRTYSGIPHETCVSCHNRGKRIGVSFQGLMEFPYGTPFDDKGGKQPKLHTKYYKFIQDDVHHRLKSREGNPEGGLLCQDCHSTTSVHGNGNITGTTLANIEVECADCHGTPQSFPWELPLGFGDEFDGEAAKGPARGLARAVDANHRLGTSYPADQGFLISARGNPMGNVTRRGEKVIVHSASGLDFEVPALKGLAMANKWQNPETAVAAKIRVGKHLETMECYTCHSGWAPQCYGCHVKVDYSGGKKSGDWVASGNAHTPDGHTAESRGDGKMMLQPGKASEARSYLRWENPVLGINGEGRVSPIIPGCQQITTVIGPDGKTLVNSHIWRTRPDLEHGGKKGQRGLDMAPATPHTTDRRARSCPSCHASSKALGYGTHDGRYNRAYPQGVYMDLSDNKGQLLSSRARYQIAPIPELPMDLDQVVTRQGEQLQTVGHHWPLSAPLNAGQRANMERIGICISCHEHVPDADVTLVALNKMGAMAGMVPETDAEHRDLITKLMYLTAYAQIWGPVAVVIVALLFVWALRRGRREEDD